MKKLRKMLSLLLVVVIVFSLAACSKTGAKSTNVNDVKVWYFNGEESDPEELFSGVKDTINPKEILSSIKFEENMLYGVYAVNNLEKDIKKLSKELSFKEREFDNGTFNTSSLPVGIYSGAKYLHYSESQFKEVTDREVASLQFIVDGQLGTVPCTYEIDGNKIKYTALKDTTKADSDFSYDFDKEIFEYEFSLCGPYLTITDGQDTLKLTAFSFTDNNQSEFTTLTGYSVGNTPLIHNCDYFASEQDAFINYAVARDGSYYSNVAFKFTEDGKCTVYLSYRDAEDKEQTFIEQYAYIVQCSGSSAVNSFSIILLDNEKAYYYTDSVTDREARIMESEGTDVDSIDEDTMKEIAEKKSDLYDDLYNEFEASGISVQINRSTGEIAMDSTVLFGGDSADLTDEGKEFLNKFVKAYTSIIYNDKYDGFISKTMVEGHIAPVPGTTYEGGMPLSEERAENVKDYCLSDETGVDTTKLATTMETIGYSQSKPVYDSDGNVDIEASRRVSFRFIVNTEK